MSAQNETVSHKLLKPLLSNLSKQAVTNKFENWQLKSIENREQCFQEIKPGRQNYPKMEVVRAIM